MSQEEMPSKLVIISDMEFNCCVENASETNFENARKKYEANTTDCHKLYSGMSRADIVSSL